MKYWSVFWVLTGADAGRVHGAGFAAPSSALRVAAHPSALTDRGPGSEWALDPQSCPNKTMHTIQGIFLCRLIIRLSFAELFALSSHNPPKKVFDQYYDLITKYLLLYYLFNAKDKTRG